MHVVGGDQPAVEEGGGGGDGLGDQAAGVAAQIEQDAVAVRGASRTADRTRSPEPLVKAATLIRTVPAGEAARR